MATDPYMITKEIKATKIARKIHKDNILVDNGDTLIIDTGERKEIGYLNALFKELYADKVADLIPDDMELYKRIKK